MTIGEGNVNPAPTYGCAFIDDWEGNRRPGTMADVIKCLKLIHAEDSYNFNGGIMIQPGDVPQDYASIAMFYATLLHSDKAIMLPTGFKEEMDIMLAASCALFSGKEALIKKPQVIRPGTPVVCGIQSTAAYMRGGITFACAAPEGTLMQGFAADMGRFYGFPSRGGGCQTDAPVINCQAGYESMLTFSSAYRHGINLVMEAGGVMDSVNATAFEKMIIDFEIIRQVKKAFTPFEVNEESLNLEDIKEIGHTGSFVTADSTLDNYTELYSPQIGARNAKGADYFKESINKLLERIETL